MNTPPKRKRGAELSVGRRTAMAVEIALAIPPGKTRVPKGILGPLAERYGVGPGYSTGPAIVQGCVQRFYLHYSGHLHYSEECLNSAGSALLRF